MIFDKFETVNAIENAMSSCNGESLDLMFDDVFNNDERYMDYDRPKNDLKEFVNFLDLDQITTEHDGIEGAIELVFTNMDPESDTTTDDLRDDPCGVETKIDCIRVDKILQDFFLELDNKHEYDYDSVIDQDMQNDFARYAEKVRREKVVNGEDTDLQVLQNIH